MQAKRTSTLLLIAAFGFAMLPLVGIVLKQTVERDWEEMRGIVTSMSVVRRYAVEHREALYGETAEGSAWTQYKVAVEAMRAVDQFHRVTIAAAHAKTDEQVAQRDALLVEAAPVLEYLRRGAHSRDATSHVNLGAGYAARIQRLVDVRSITALAIARAESDVDAGEHDRAVDVLLDAHQIARDLMQSPCLIEEMIGSALLVPDAMKPFLADGGARRLSDQAMERWLAALEQLSDSLPLSGNSFRGELEMTGWHFLNAEKRGDWDEDPPIRGETPGFRYGFSWRGAVADYALRVHDVADDVDAAYQLQPTAALERLAVLEKRLRGSPNPIVRACLPKLSSGGVGRLSGIARVVLLRHALALELGRMPELPGDPMGHGIHVERTPDRTRVWTEYRHGQPLEIVIGSRR